MEDQKHEIIRQCKEYLKAFPDAKKVVFISKEPQFNDLDIRSYIRILMENYGLSQIAKYQKNSIINLKLTAKSDEFMELCKISSKVIELETYKSIDKEIVYRSFVENMNFHRKHNLNFSVFKKNIEHYVSLFCNDELAHRITGKAMLKWLGNEEYTEELLGKFKEFDFSLSYNMKKIMNAKLDELSTLEAEFIKDKCIDEIMLDKIIYSLYQSGYLKNIELDQIQISNMSRKSDSIASHLENSRHWYTTLRSISIQKFSLAAWF
ncbi:MAG: hypothetical protein VKK32_00520 [Candidatus Melainabacteria bacterium]|nr:hypothetical protein [Candidatus Melainabacteria bacterium]